MSKTPKIVDYLIIGGGITGAGILRECKLRKVSAILIDKNDFASGTSSKSSKLIHGGIRYLENYDFKLVFEACQERYNLMNHIAPHLVKKAEFIYPIRSNFSLDSIKIRLGLLTYDLLSARKSIGKHSILNYSQIHSQEPSLEPSISRGGKYYDCMTNDARLVLDTIKGAVSKETFAFNYLEILGSKFEHGFHYVIVKNTINGQMHTIKCKEIINATGAWSANTITRTSSLNRPQVLFSKGVHFIAPKFLIGNNGNIITKTTDGRVIFILDWGNVSLVGTTDTAFVGDVNDVCATKQDIHYLLGQLTKWFPNHKVNFSNIISTFAGLRPLASGDKKETAKVSREHQIIYDDQKRVYSIIGGKLTTFRSMAEHMLDELDVIRPKEYNSLTPISGGEEFDTIEAMSYLTECFNPEDSWYLLNKYGSNCFKLLYYVDEAKNYSVDLALACQILYAIKFEFAKTHLDILFRRTWIYLVDKTNGVHYLPVVSAMLKDSLGYSDELTNSMEKDYSQFVDNNRRCLN